MSNHLGLQTTLSVIRILTVLFDPPSPKLGHPTHNDSISMNFLSIIHTEIDTTHIQITEKNTFHQLATRSVQACMQSI